MTALACTGASTVATATHQQQQQQQQEGEEEELQPATVQVMFALLPTSNGLAWPKHA